MKPDIILTFSNEKYNILKVYFYHRLNIRTYGSLDSNSISKRG